MRRTRGEAARTRAARGHTLVELLAVLGIVVVAGGVAVPSFHEARANLQRDERVRELRRTLHLARTEALARGVPVVVCAGEHDCVPDAPWSAGWIAFADTHAPRGRRSPDEAMLAQARATTVHVRANRAALRFDPTAVAATTATFSVCDERGARAARTVIVSRTGRVRTTAPGLAGAPPACG